MKITNNTFLFSIAAAAVMAASANAQVLQVGGVGSSALFQTASLAAYTLAGGPGTAAGHYTASNGGTIVDQRGDGQIANQTGNIAVIWDNANSPTKVWYFLNVDSVVGNRAYFSQPRSHLTVSNAAATQIISSALWGADTSTIPAAVLAVVNNSAFTAALTDILPADAKFAQNRVNCGTAATATLGCLGYGTSDPNVGTSIVSAFSSSNAQPVNFNIYGNDPITGNAIPTPTVVPMGISPIVFIVNRTNPNGFGQGVTATSGGTFADITYEATAQLLFTGTNCNSSAFGNYNSTFAINPILREPLSGTMNTTEFNVFVTNANGQVAGLYFSQEGVLNPPFGLPGNFNPINASTNNPLNGACPGNSPYAYGAQGARKRAIGTGQEVGTASNGAGVYNVQDSIGYTFFSYGNVASLAAGGTKYGYLTYQTVDPINPSGSYNKPYVSNGLNWPGYGQLPTCTAPCSITPGSSFPNIRNGAYKAWSLLRGVSDGSNVAALTTLANAVGNEVNNTVPDFLPFNATSDGDPGFIGYRIHFVPGANNTPAFNFNATNTPNNGLSNETPPGPEAGGDVGGCLDYRYDPNQTGCRY